MFIILLKKEKEMEKEILKKLDELSQKINELEKKVNDLKNRQDVYPIQPINVPFMQEYDQCPQGGQHEYPFPWHSVTAPFCKKCGQQGQKLEITYSEYPEPKTGDTPDVWFYDFNSKSLIHEDDYNDDYKTNLNQFNSNLKNYDINE